jgi:hypothetical protein
MYFTARLLAQEAEVDKVTLKSNSDESLSDEFCKKKVMVMMR